MMLVLLFAVACAACTLRQGGFVAWPENNPNFVRLRSCLLHTGMFNGGNTVFDSATGATVFVEAPESDDGNEFFSLEAGRGIAFLKTERSPFASSPPCASFIICSLLARALLNHFGDPTASATVEAAAR